MKAAVYKIRKTVPQTAIDGLGHVNNVTYLEWVQEISQQHWQTAVPQSIRDRVFWVVLNHFIAYKSPSFAGEELELKTWVETQEGAKSERRVEITRMKDGKLIVQAATLWCLMDAVTKRPRWITHELDTLYNTP